MEMGRITTPFGRRAMTLALVKPQMSAEQSVAAKPVDKWRVLRDVSDARSKLGLQDRALAILNALLSFYPATELTMDSNLVVFPSNNQLSARANGIAGTTLRKNLAILVEAGIIIRKDSPNGKRYARKTAGGHVEDAYGFSLAPLVSRASEFAALAHEVAEEQRRFRTIKDRLSIARRDVRKLISMGMMEGLSGPWEAVEASYVAIVSRIPRRPTLADLVDRLDEMNRLHDDVTKMLENQQKAQKNDSNAIVIRHHIQNSNTESIIELEPAFEKKQDEKTEARPTPQHKTQQQVFPLSMVLRACPDVVDYGPKGCVTNWSELMAAAVTIRTMLGVSPSAYEEACEVMGSAAAAIAIACIHERAAHITSPGGYLRDLTAKAKRGEFSLGPMLFALMRGRMEAQHLSA